VGIYAFTATVHVDNQAMIGLVRSGHRGVEHSGSDVLEYAISLTSLTAETIGQGAA